jgi:hypothetical protein
LFWQSILVHNVVQLTTQAQESRNQHWTILGLTHDAC